MFPVTHSEYFCVLFVRRNDEDQPGRDPFGLTRKQSGILLCGCAAQIFWPCLRQNNSKQDALFSSSTYFNRILVSQRVPVRIWVVTPHVFVFSFRIIFLSK